MEEKDGRLWQTRGGVISGSASGDNCTAATVGNASKTQKHKNTNTKSLKCHPSGDISTLHPWTIAILFGIWWQYKLDIESTTGGQSSPCSADPVSWEPHSFISQLRRLRLRAPSLCHHHHLVRLKIAITIRRDNCGLLLTRNGPKLHSSRRRSPRGL